MKLKPILSNIDARIPFSIIGIFILLGSTTTAVFLSSVGNEHAEVIIDSKESTIELLLISATTDISSLLSNAGLQATKIIGHKPVVISNIKGMAASEVNRMRCKQIISDNLNEYLLLNYHSNAFNDGRYALNIQKNSYLNFPLTANDIDLTTISMNVKRPLDLAFFGPQNTCNHEVYWKVSVNLPIQIRNITRVSNKLLINDTLPISTLIPSRLPLLEQLVYEFNNTINGLNPLWNLFTLTSNSYALARGYKHYRSGSPSNVVDNRHLTPLVNGCLLFQEGLLFGSIDPKAIISVVSKSKNSFSNQEIIASEALTTYTSDHFSIPLEDFTRVCTNIDAQSPVNETIDYCPHINLTEIAEQPLLNKTMLTLLFLDKNNNQNIKTIDSPTSEKLFALISEQHKQGNTFLRINTAYHEENKTTKHTIQSIISQIYSANFSTEIQRDFQPTIIYGDHAGFPIDNGSEAWEISEITYKYQTNKPVKGSIAPFSCLYSEVYDITWSRKHYWSKKTTIEYQNDTRTLWQTFTSIDTKVEQNVSFSIIVNTYASIKDNENDIHDVFYYNISLNDNNLKDTLETYNRTVFQRNLSSLFRQSTGIYLQKEILGNMPSWVYPEAYAALNELLEKISNIHQNNSLSSSRYPDPTELLYEVFNDLQKQYQDLRSDLLDESSYYTMNRFSSTGKKAVFSVSNWYVSYIDQLLNETFSKMISLVNEQLSTALTTYTNVSLDQMHETMDRSFQESIGNQLSFSIGVPLYLSSKNVQNGWNETITLAIRQIPSYLDPYKECEYEGKKEYFLGVKNICLLGSTGFPLLPLTPTTPWVATMNLWLIQIRGSIAEFTVLDVNNEGQPHSLFGHESQTYTRKYEAIRSTSDQLLGLNTRITISLDSIACSIVPAGGCMVGDLPNELIEHNGKIIE